MRILAFIPFRFWITQAIVLSGPKFTAMIAWTYNLSDIIYCYTSGNGDVASVLLWFLRF